MKKFFAVLFVFLSLSAVYGQAFTDIGSVLSGVDNSSVEWGDYDNDGDLDVLLTGYTGTSGLTKIYTNKGNSTFTDNYDIFTTVGYSSTVWGDYDNDGDLDILLTGYSSAGRISKIYRNESSVYSDFTDIKAVLTGVSSSSVAWGDYDNDGDLDILITGSTGTLGISKIYRNDSGFFTDINAGLVNVYCGSVAWGDYDNDGDLDILITGSTGTLGISKIYRNDSGVFTDINAGLTGVFYSSSDWGDYDNDGDLDILLTGSSSTGRISKIYRNDAGIFTDTAAGLEGVSSSSVAWGDYDNDGDLDLLLTGDTGSAYVSKIYRNDSGVFTAINSALTGVSTSSVDWGDYDNDGDLDILMTGNTGSVRTSKIYRNNSVVMNTKPEAPASLSSVLNEDEITLSWNKSTDAQTPQNGLSYNLNIRTDSNEGNMMNSMSNMLNGYRKVVRLGNANQNTSWTIKDLLAGTYYWSVQAVDNSGAGSPFSSERSFTVTSDAQPSYEYVNSLISGVNNGALKWGDYDNDGDLDVIVTGDNASGKLSKIYRNNGDGTFTDINAGLPGAVYSSVDWGDYDNDGDLDFIIMGFTEYWPGASPISRVYRNNGGVFTNINAGLTGLGGGTCDWGDYDNDGDLDLLITGKTMASVYTRFTTIYRNNSGVFTEINEGLPDFGDSSVDWGDYDNDGDLDILISGGELTYQSTTNRTHIYRNDSGAFVNINAGLPVVFNPSASWGDYDNDGDLDILLTGKDYYYTSVSKIYENNSGIFTDINAGLASLVNGSAVFGDIDNDGDLDIGLCGSNGSIGVTKLYKNSGDGNFTEFRTLLTGVMQGKIEFGDYNADGNLDIAVAGLTGTGKAITNIYKNTSIIKNTLPSAPVNLISQIINGNQVIFSWDRSNDSETPQNGLSYNIIIGTSTNKNSVKSAMSNITNGYRKIVNIGNTNKTNLWKIFDLPKGTYFWRVQAIDNSFAGSVFSEEKSFAITYETPVFTDINAGLTGVRYSSVDWGDYDNDGDLDILLTGYSSTGGISKIYHNESGVFTDINAGLIGVKESSVAWGDFDNDGDLDILLIGSTGSAYISKIYRNDSGVFTDINAVLTGVSTSSAAWGDYDNDGDLDILLTGYTGTTSISKIYRNDSGVLTDINAGLIGVKAGSSAWGDYDNDGDLDILITGYTGTTNISKIYRNDTGVFTDINAILTGVRYSSVDWGDYDNDGDLDVLITGYYGAEISKIYRNDAGLFTDINAGLINVFFGSAAWGDYDNDGYLDIITTGYEKTTRIYRNRGNGSFIEINHGLTGVSYSSAAWGDYDKDGDLDVLLTGDSGSGYVSKIYRNSAGNLNTKPLPPSNLNFTIEGSDALLSWDKTTDAQTPQNGLSYNLYIGTSPLTGNKNSPMSDITTGYRKIVNIGNSQQNTSWAIKDLEDGKYNWSVQAVDNGFLGSEFAQEQNFVISHYQEISTPFTPLSYSSNAWGDYDNDGDLDLIITGEAGTGVYCTKIYNNNSGVFTETATGMANISAGSVAWGDYDNDGDVDVLLSGYTGSTGVTKVYRNDGSGTFTDISAGLPGCYYNSVTWGDYDNDGDLDILITGYVNSTTRLSEIYRNDGNGVFTDINAGLINLSSSSGAWGDYDSDGDLDILLTGYSSTGAVSKIYRNDNGVFTDIAAGLTGVFKSSVAWGDYDNDGDLDILLTGMPTTSTYTSEVYRNDSGGVFTDIAAGLINAGYSSAVWTDYNNDGYLDVLLSGNSDGSVVAKIYKNDLDGTFSETTHYLEPVKFCSVTACDYNNDGRSDYLVSGNNGTERVTKLYKSNMPVANTKPAAPANLSSVRNGSEMTLSWNKATDAQTPQNGLSYNLYIGTTPLTGNKKSPMSNVSTGYRKVVSLGNAGSKNSWTAKNLPPGTYYWSVQAVDNAYAGSLFSGEQTFTLSSIPQNINVVYAAGNVTLSWTGVPGTVSYKVYASEDPYGTFTDVSSQGTLTGTSWSQAVSVNKLFYYVVAVTAKAENINQSVKVKK